MLIPNAPAVADMSDSAPTIPEATYNLRVHKAEYVAVPKGKDAKGPYIKVQCIVTGPGDIAQIGRFVFQNYSLTKEGNFRLKELLIAAGKPDDYQLVDDQELVGLEFGAAVIIKAGTGGYADKNEIRQHLQLL